MVEQPIYEMENQTATYGTSWELPILLPLTNEKGDITKYMFMISPAPASTADNKAYYFLGDFDEDGQIYGETTDRGEAASPGAVSGELQLINGELAMDIYIDRSLVEGFFNESKALSIRSYSDYEAQQISVFGDDDVKVKDICIAKMGSI